MGSQAALPLMLALYLHKRRRRYAEDGGDSAVGAREASTSSVLVKLAAIQLALGSGLLEGGISFGVRVATSVATAFGR